MTLEVFLLGNLKLKAVWLYKLGDA